MNQPLRSGMLIALCMVLGSAPVDGQQRRLRQPASSAAQYRAAEPALSNRDRVTMINTMTGLTLTMVDQPIRLSVKHPDHLGQVFITALGTTAFTGAPMTGGRELWTLGTLQLVMMKGVADHPALVDCLADGRRMTPGGPAELRLVFEYAGPSSIQTIPLQASPGHVIAALPPPAAGREYAMLSFNAAGPGQSISIYYCEITEFN